MMTVAQLAISELYGFVGFAEGTWIGVQQRFQLDFKREDQLKKAKDALKLLRRSVTKLEAKESARVADLPNCWP